MMERLTHNQLQGSFPITPALEKLNINVMENNHEIKDQEIRDQLKQFISKARQQIKDEVNEIVDEALNEEAIAKQIEDPQKES